MNTDGIPMAAIGDIGPPPAALRSRPGRSSRGSSFAPCLSWRWVAAASLALAGGCSGCGVKRRAATAVPKGPSPNAAQRTEADRAAAGSSRERRAHVTRNPRWAVPIERPGLPNFHRVSDDLCRGAQPEAEGIRELEKLGVRTIVNLRLVHSDRDEIRQAGLTTGSIGYEHIRMEAWDADADEVLRFLEIVTDPAKTPVFVHCKHGADRTGMTCAVYRIVVQGWSREDAVEEMREGGFGFHAIWRGLPEYLRELDVERMRREAGLGDSSGLQTEPETGRRAHIRKTECCEFFP